MTTESFLRLGAWGIGDRFPFPYFVFTEKSYDATNRRFNTLDLDPADYTAIKFCARHQSNNSDFDDHTLDNIYSNLTSDGNGVYHYAWIADDIDKAGRWEVRLEMERADGTFFHPPFTWYFYAEHKMSGTFGDH